VIQEFTGVEMMLVPAGCFIVGSVNGNVDEYPPHKVCFKDPFWIDRTEVTNAQFATFKGRRKSLEVGLETTATRTDFMDRSTGILQESRCAPAL